MSLVLPIIDGRGHTLSCLRYGDQAPLAGGDSTHIDLFCECHSWDAPRILANETDIAWPAGWTLRQAGEWRQKNNLSRRLLPLT